MKKSNPVLKSSVVDFTQINSAREMFDAFAKLTSARANGKISKEDFESLASFFKGAGKLYGDNVREQVAHIQARSQNIDLSELPRLFSATPQTPKLLASPTKTATTTKVLSNKTKR